MHDRSNVARGRWGEALACRHLQRSGHRIVDLDVVSFDGDVVVFSEVKARRRVGFGGAAAAVDDRKQQQIRSLAESWLRLHGELIDRVRFDVIAIDGVHLTHLEAAF